MTQHELERIASLATHPGWHAILKLVDEADQILLDRLETAPADKETEILNLWRASRRFKKLVQNQPESLSAELEAILPPLVS